MKLLMSLMPNRETDSNMVNKLFRRRRFVDCELSDARMMGFQTEKLAVLQGDSECRRGND